ncbi:MAG: hypothetical protein QM756_29435 [Polyangiaceae bacterium]
MGCSLSWIAFKGLEPDAVLARLRWEDTSTEVLSWEGYTAGALLAGGFYLIQLDDCFHRLLEPDSLTQLSQGCSVVACQADEHVMFSSSFEWVDGALRWQLTHNSENGRYDLQVEATPPLELTAIQAHATAQQDADGGADSDTDYLFSVPIDLAAQLVGFHHDRAAQTAFRPPWSSFTRLDPVDA